MAGLEADAEMAAAAGARRGRGEVSLAALTTEGAAARRGGMRPGGCSEQLFWYASARYIVFLKKKLLCTRTCLTVSELWSGKGSQSMLVCYNVRLDLNVTLVCY